MAIETDKIVGAEAFPREILKDIFLAGKTLTIALQSDPRISYALYIPDSHYPPSSTVSQLEKLPLVVTIHGTSRDHLLSREVWISFAEKHKVAVLAPLFVAGLQGPMESDGYTSLGLGVKSGSKAQSQPLRYDLTLLDILKEVSLRWPGINTSKFFLAGFSAGGQFTQRFLLLHPEKLLAVSVGAPGSTTDLSSQEPWPKGLGGIDDSGFDSTKILAGLLDNNPPILIAVGQEDTDLKQLRLKSKLNGTNEEPLDRLTEAKNLAQQWKELGLNVSIVTVPGAKHNLVAVNPSVEAWLAELVESWWKNNT